jgi:hypothetical protein
MRFFFGTGRYTPNAAVAGDMVWEPIFIKQLECVASTWCRSASMNSMRINCEVNMYSIKQAYRTCKNWYFRVK